MALKSPRLVAVLCLGISLTLAASGCGGSSDKTTDSPSGGGSVDAGLRAMLPQSIQDAGVVTVAGGYYGGPILAADPSDVSKPKGLAVNLTEALGNELGVEFKWSDVKFPGQLPGLAGGRFHVVMGQISDTAEREETIADMFPFFYQPNGMVVRKGNPEVITNLESLCGKRVAYATGALFGPLLVGASKEYCAPHGKPDIKRAEFDTTQASVTALLSGQVVGYYGEAEETDGIAQTNPKFEGVRLPYEETQKYDAGLTAIATDKKNADLMKAIAAAMQKLRESGKYEEILAAARLERAVVDEAQYKINPLSGTAVGKTK